MKSIKALSLFSGGLDSILAARLIMEQGIELIAVQFVTPFFSYEILQDVEAYQAEVKRKYGINVLVENISPGYMELLRKPVYGFGKNFNPCIDCKIFMLKRAKELMVELGASFLVTGEVVGQRPMSQRRDALNVISRDSDNKTVLLRPLSAKLMPETEAEQKGWVDREKLLAFGGRGRAPQMALAKEYGISDYPAPAGGCILADPILSKRIKRLYAGEFNFGIDDVGVTDIELMLVGRQLLVPQGFFTWSAGGEGDSGFWLIVGRNEEENLRLEGLAEEGDVLFYMEDRSGPNILLRRALGALSAEQEGELFALAASLVVRYGRKIDGGFPPEMVTCKRGETSFKIMGEAPEGDSFRAWNL
ncbi:hypothetical protein [Desulfotalea psychrophila]|uniref:Uncharacterized protein n=1 Tax=Desulfotalea psychrophila (strain LSv54 / DSM 12343) TaxID=177439 RepID=Q6AIY6_DESPS|nr:hypothetical protein [Desulfotalea psychrophila]CAG37694.1 conserved hypothetical protein [Desulfotalea psychrophila LSv54]